MNRELFDERRLQATYKLLESLQDSHDRYKNLVETLSDIVFEHVAGGLSFLNPAWSGLTGWDNPTSLDRPLRDFVLTDDEDLLNQWLKACQDDPGNPMSAELRLQCADGRICWVDIRGRYLPTGDKYSGIIRDITQRKTAELALIESEHRFKDMADSAPVMIWLSGPDKLFQYFNQIWLNFTGRTLEREQGYGWSEAIHADDVDQIISAYIHAFDARQPFSMDFRLRRRDGEYRWVKMNGNPHFDAHGEFLGFIGSCVDVSELKQAEQYFRVLVECSPIAMLLVNERGLIELANQQLGQVFGYDSQALIGQAVEQLIPQALRRQHEIDRKSYAREPSPRRMGFHRTVMGQRKNGSTFPAEVGLSPIRLNDRDHVLVVLADITERKEAEQAIRDLNLNLEQKVVERTMELENANEAKSRFLAQMSHEIRTPLNAVLGIAQLLGTEPLAPGQKAMVRHIGEAGQLLLHIVNDILDLAKIEAGKLTIESRPFSLSRMLENVLSMSRTLAASKGLVLRNDLRCQELGEVLGDAMRLEQVLLNLISNAVKFTDQGDITFSVRVSEQGAERVSVCFAVRDTGIGMDEDSLSRIFKPFIQADDSITRRFGGTGLGLSISQFLVSEMGGQLKVQSVVGEGSVFSFELPFARVQHGKTVPQPGLPSEVAQAGALANEDHSLEGLCVLIVDDSAINRMVAERALVRHGARVLQASDGQIALDMLRSHPDDIDLVLMDIQMPVMDGVTATREIRKDPALASCPVIALTAGVMVEERQAALDAGVNEFLTKPFDLKKMIAVIFQYSQSGRH